MDSFNEKGMFSKLKTLISSLYGITLWTSALPSPIQIPKEWPISAHHPSGLKTLIYPPAEAPLQDQNHPCLAVHSCMIIPSSSPPSPPPPPPPPHLASSSSSSPSGNSPVAPPFESLSHSLSFSSSSSSIMDDLIGTESGVYIKSNEFETSATTMEENQQVTATKRSRRAMTTAKTKTKKYPPPIPLLARTGNLPGHMPWVLTREYRDGRLILKEQRVKHHEYFEAHRGNNRLVLNLISLDSKVRCCHAVRDQHKQEKEEEIELQDPVFADENTAKEREEEDKGEEVEEAAKTKDAVREKVVVVKEMPAASSAPKPCVEDKSKKCGDLRKCFTYSGKMISDFSLSCNANANRNTARSTDNSSGPPLVATARPVTTVV